MVACDQGLFHHHLAHELRCGSGQEIIPALEKILAQEILGDQNEAVPLFPQHDLSDAPASQESVRQRLAHDQT